MFDPQCNLAALVYEDDQDPDGVLSDFANDLNARGFRAVGMVQTGQCADSSLSAVLLHSGETLLLAQDFDLAAAGCRLDLNRLQNAGARIATALEAGADLLIVNRFGKRERDGKGLADLIYRALDAKITVLIAVSRQRLADWTKFSGGMSANLRCDRDALDSWWQGVSAQKSGSINQDQVVREPLK